ncbi:MAG: hypothetical protein EOR30_08445 [Mesorhizobium sp.]|uniref:hypothetical protein n=1 Tax=unclassified Mesorhizobium TaxID=325217 RepID=UPI000FCC236F|nr:MULTISPECIES: hypothetical protein [unclassified Mesorhizobium]RUV70610.1 hypothetical protein EOA78_20115 [Mesorhizobium sp. M5C.F.Cr.IN.023.01.1.1]RWF84713.1 MAG: hypothetical protein EOQ36_25175 [Mesorhizobium sp.]RWF91457.1 MAG: hypothetical protein EOQ45_25715 [Mesorhizobium sp.]RWI43322.1 MAG: hypothetical protein EOR14_01645 [Mesorhizobium sp.]RWI47653.1 MAG: hypothetical protein EOR15_14370 [Mesorhizobium sp.]
MNGTQISTYRPIPQVETAVLDANVLLDAALIVDGVGANAVAALNARGVKLVTSARAWEELHETLSKFRNGLAPIDAIVDKVLAGKVEIRTAEGSLSKISDHDRHVALLAAECKGCLLTEDLELINDMNAASLHARTLRETLYEYHSLPSGIIPAAHGTAFGADGHIFAKADAHLDILGESREWNLFANEDLGRVAYDSRLRSFCFFGADDSPLLNVPFELQPDVTFAIALDYATGSSSTTFSLKVCYQGSDDVCTVSTRAAALKRAPRSDVRWLNRFEKPEGWKGHFQVGTFGPYRLSRSSWRSSRRLVGVAPSTLTADLSFCAALLCDVKSDAVRRPTWSQAATLSHISAPGFYPGTRAKEREASWFPDSWSS